jgi:hypothetical protein
MKKHLLLLATAILLAGCSATIDEPERYLKNTSIEYLDFAHDLRFPYSQLGYTANEPFKTLCSYEYTNGLVTKVSGGFKQTNGATDVAIYVYSQDVYDSLIYKEKIVNVYTKPAFSYFSGDVTENPTIYELNSEGNIARFTRRDGYEVTYAYNGDAIFEKNSDGDTLRVLYKENDNLIKIVKNYRDGSGKILSVSETLFENYDNSSNPFKGRYYLIGAFYRAFSENNYTDVTQNYYVMKSDGTLSLLSTTTTSIPISYDEYGYPRLGDYE